MFLAIRKKLTSSKLKLLSSISILALLAAPVSGLTAATSDTSKDQIQTLGSVLDQADHLRIRGKTPEQFKQAFSLYQHAANDGVAVAQYWLGVMYFEGKGTEPDSGKGKSWIHLSAKQDFPAAKEYLSENMQDDDESDEEEEDC